MWSSPHDLAVIFRAAMANPVFAQITAQPTTVFPTKTGDKVLVNQDELLKRYPGTIGGKTGFTEHRAEDVRRRRRAQRPSAGRRLDVRHGQARPPHLLGSGSKPAGLGLRAGPECERRLAVEREVADSQRDPRPRLEIAEVTLGARAKAVGCVGIHGDRGVVAAPKASARARC